MKLSTTHRGRFATVLCGLLFLVLGTFYAGSLFGRYLVVNYLLFEYPLSTNIKASLRQLLHLDHSYSLAEGAQDRWIARCLMQGSATDSTWTSARPMARFPLIPNCWMNSGGRGSASIRFLLRWMSGVSTAGFQRERQESHLPCGGLTRRYRSIVGLAQGRR